MLKNDIIQNYKMNDLHAFLFNDLYAYELIEKIKIMSDNDFINLAYFTNLHDHQVIADEQYLFNTCFEQMTDLDHKLMEHFRGDYVNTSKVYDELYNFAINYKSDFLIKIKKNVIKSLQEKYNIYIGTV